MTARPDLTALLANPAGIDAVPAAEVPALLAMVAAEQVRLAALQGALAARLVGSNGNGHGEPDRLLTVDEAAERLGVTKDWLRRRPELPFVVKCSEGVVRYSSRGIEHWIAARLRRGPC